jgi:hypothetical protein
MECSHCEAEALRVGGLLSIIAEARKELLRTTWPETTQNVLVGCLQRALEILGRADCV